MGLLSNPAKNNTIKSAMYGLVSQMPKVWLKAGLEAVSGKKHKKKALAGVGNPIKLELCLESLLNLARRKAELSGMANAR